MTWVKVCGLRTTADVKAATRAGADAVGFVLAQDSPRAIRPDHAARLIADADLPSFLVTVDASPAEILDLVDFTAASGVQPHGADSAAAAAAAKRAGLAVLRPFRVTEELDLSGVPVNQIPLLDTHVPGLHGGTGLRFDSELLPVMERDWVMAGGLDPDNVAEAIRTLSPWGVDASSRLESSPGHKDHDLIAAFVREAKRV
ncbi:MAG TPA: phosphoribosylanthranilate isomerase [Acidimicrobiia bacterium]|nr:phosphoribosylanthranilate isomerase [Acidimicrobiia bacterium]